VAVGEQAFAYDTRRLVYWEGERPKAGSRVWFQKYAGFEYTGHDGLMYRVMEDRQIAAMDIPVPPLDEPLYETALASV
jgi:co-chaperonin GroES (HSP10)